MRSRSYSLFNGMLLCAIVCVAVGTACSTSTLEGVPPNGTDGGSFPDAFTSNPTLNNDPNNAPVTDMGEAPRDLGSSVIPDATASTDMTVDVGIDAADVGMDLDMAPMLTPACAVSCTVPADCVTLTGGLFDEENYECDNGGCRWLGCVSDAECEMVVGAGRRCVAGAFPGIRSCLPTCTVPADCSSAGTGAYDADNYDCNQGRCEYKGCNNDAECQNLGATYRCAQTNLAYPTCVLSCSTPAQCGTGTGAYDSDNYACTSGACEYIGCVSDAECQTTNPTFICR